MVTYTAESKGVVKFGWIKGVLVCTYRLNFRVTYFCLLESLPSIFMNSQIMLSLPKTVLSGFYGGPN